MEFSSAGFLFIFLPAAFLIHAAIPSRAKRARNLFLILASLDFYAGGGIFYVPVLVLSSLVNYSAALLMKRGRKGFRRFILVLACVLDIGALAVFKYSAFFVGTLNSVFGTSFSVPELVSPLGISFFTFRALSCVIDAYRGDAEPEKNFIKYLLYSCFFAHTAQGPITRYGEMGKELEERKVSLEGASKGLRLFIIGLSMKLIIANTLGKATSFVFSMDASELNAAYAWTGAAAFTLRLYFDFAGYSLSAVGLGLMFGFNIPANFDYPLLSESMTDFWRRWHITLSRWFRDYVYIPLGGNRKGRLRTALNKMIVFLLTGLWHGANWTFAAWGAYNGALVAAEGAIKRKKLRVPKPVKHFYAILTIVTGFAVFASPDLPYAWAMLRSMFTGFSVGRETAARLSYVFSPTVIAVLAAALVSATPLSKKLFSKLENKPLMHDILGFGSALLLLALAVFFLASGNHHPSIYASF